MVNVCITLPNIIKEDISYIVEKFSNSKYADNIIRIILFGSFANDTHQPDSDIDLAIVVKNKLEKRHLAEYYLMTDNLTRSTDFIFCTEEQVLSGKYVYSEILRKGVTVYENV